MLRGIQTRFTLIFSLLTIIPLLVVGTIVGFISFSNLRSQAQTTLTQTSEAVADQIENYITARTDELQLLIDTTGLTEETAQSTIENLLFRTDLYEEIALLDAEGNEIIFASRIRVVQDEDLTNRSDDIAFTSILEGASIFYSNVVFDEAAREPLMTISLPVIDLRSGELQSVLVADFRFRPIWQQLTDLELGNSTLVYLIDDATQSVIAHPDPSVVLRGTTVDSDTIVEENFGLLEENVLVGTHRIELGSRTFETVAEQPTSEALSIAQQLVSATLIVTIVALIGTVIVVTIVVLQIVRPIKNLSDVANEIQQGDLSLRADVNTDDEIGDLATSFNSMTAQMDDLIQNLESRVAARTRDLQVAADIAKEVTTVLSIDELLPELVELTRAGFDLYHTSIFLNNQDSNKLEIAASTGDAGQFMLSQAQSFKLDARGLVPTAGRTRTAALANDVGVNEFHIANPALPNTKSELALPMIVGDQLVGVLDMQSEQLDGFSEDDMRVLQSLADQLAIAVQNARLYASQLETTEELRRLDSMKSQFLASMSHELRTPLNAILNFSQFVRSGKLGEINTQQETALSKTVESGEHLLSLINDVLDVAKIEAGMMELFIEEDIDLLKETKTAVAAGETIIKDKPVELFTHFPDNVPLIVADRRRVRQIALNLISNACKYTNEGRVDIYVEVGESTVLLKVKDTGVGIAPEDLDLVFESFRQTQDGLRQAGGSGLGLAISKQLTDQHYGTLECTSELGQGSTFTLTLPLRSPMLVQQVF